MTTSNRERKPRLSHAAYMRREIERRGLRLERTGKAWRITGYGVDMTVSALEHLTAQALAPHVSED